MQILTSLHLLEAVVKVIVQPREALVERLDTK